MGYQEIFVLALALSVDAFVVSFSYGMVFKKNQWHLALKLAAAIGAGQFIMPIIGWYGTLPLSKYVEKYDHWLIFLVFAILGLNIIIKALEGNPKKIEKNLSFLTLLMIGLATSIDALAIGVSLYFSKTPIFGAATIIGLIAFIMSLCGFFLPQFFNKLPQRFMEISAGVILILLGAKVLCEHMMWY